MIDKIIGRLDQLLSKDYPNNEQIHEVFLLSPFFASSVLLTEENNQNYARGSPTETFFSSLPPRENRIGLPSDKISLLTSLIFFLFCLIFLAKRNFNDQNCESNQIEKEVSLIKL